MDDRVQAVAADGQGRVAVTGHFQGTTDFGNGSVSSYVHPNLGPTRDIFVAEYSPSGGYLWARAIGSDSSEEGKGIATDAAGNVLVTGYQGSYVVDYGGGPQYSQAYTDIFIAKYSSAGVWQWSKTIGGDGYDQGNAIAADPSGNVLVTGYIGSGSTADFGGVTLTNAGGTDIFVAKYAPNGVLQWAQRFGGAGAEVGTAIATDGLGNVYLAGTFDGTMTVGPVTLVSAGSRDGFLVKFLPTGAFVYAARFGGAGDDVPSGLAVNGANLLIAGKFQQSIVFGTTQLVSAGGDDAFLADLTSSAGIAVWAKRFGSTGGDIALAIFADLSETDICGYFTGSVDFGTGTLSSVAIDVFAAGYDASGAALWSKRFGGADTQICQAITSSPVSGVVLGGFFASALDLGSGTMTSAGGQDGFTGRIR